MLLNGMLLLHMGNTILMFQNSLLKKYIRVAAYPVALCVLLSVFAKAACAQTIGLDGLEKLTPGKTRAENALWNENPISTQFISSKTVVVAEMKGPGIITMMHFAMPSTLKLNRAVVLRIYWDGESSPSVEVPLVDFFADPDGLQHRVNTALVNKRRGWNAYFPMPFRRSAKVELVYNGPLQPGNELESMMPCYSYVLWRGLKSVPADAAYLHASWRQQKLFLGKQDYVALDATGKGKFVGWNVTVRSLHGKDYPVDENEKFYIDGEKNPSVEFQGLEDSFGFSWGFPTASDNSFQLTGYFKFLNGAAAYRFFTQDAINFDRSLRVAIGFGAHEDPVYRIEGSKPDSAMQFSSTVYWYQLEPHAPLPPMPPASEREPADSTPLGTN
jgi:hypothetical protein